MFTYIEWRGVITRLKAEPYNGRLKEVKKLTHRIVVGILGIITFTIATGLSIYKFIYTFY